MGVQLDGKPLKAAFGFKYLGGKYRADRDQKQALEHRMALAADGFRELRSHRRMHDLEVYM